MKRNYPTCNLQSLTCYCVGQMSVVQMSFDQTLRNHKSKARNNKLDLLQSIGRLRGNHSVSFLWRYLGLHLLLIQCFVKFLTSYKYIFVCVIYLLLLLLYLSNNVVISLYLVHWIFFYLANWSDSDFVKFL